ncbi:hypothetical protein NQ317_004672 [Molorchus minor]|uniref:t-SNARE coiled-coil homology domain-containing protein n=1 Tax=Molorchus minor TaxID=1323400 RepID=A0ABQ9J505_9CUCU|nr:hypothetical protein NQ317_004672 [Molorchus minor]
MRQREKLEKTDRQLDEINATLRFSQKHINGIKSVFSSLKNYMSGKNEASPTTSSSTPSTVKSASNLDNKLSDYDRYDNHPATRLRDNDYSSTQTHLNSSSGSKDFSTRLDANLQEMCSSISVLKGLASELGSEIDSQNELIGNITDKAERADLTITKQSDQMNKILKK